MDIISHTKYGFMIHKKDKHLHYRMKHQWEMQYDSLKIAKKINRYLFSFSLFELLPFGDSVNIK